MTYCIKVFGNWLKVHKKYFLLLRLGLFDQLVPAGHVTSAIDSETKILFKYRVFPYQSTRLTCRTFNLSETFERRGARDIDL